jgi:hypothetical protein
MSGNRLDRARATVDLLVQRRRKLPDVSQAGGLPWEFRVNDTLIVDINTYYDSVYRKLLRTP